MRIVLQRVSGAQVVVDGVVLGRIGKGIVALVGFAPGDTHKECQWMMEKILSLRIFEGDSGKMEQSLSQVAGEILLIPQFTLYGDLRKGTRPSFSRAMAPDEARQFFAWFVQEFHKQLDTVAGTKVQEGRFGADMKVTLTNDGPVTLILDSLTSERS